MELTMAKRDWWKTPDREPSGRLQRHWQPDRGTEQIQEKRASVMGDHRQPVDLSDPIDRLHRGQIKHLTDTQALAAYIWRQRKREVLGGEGPRMAMLSDQVRKAPPPEDPYGEHRARIDLGKIDWALEQCGQGVTLQCKATVERMETPRRLQDLKRGLTAIAKALEL